MKLAFKEARDIGNIRERRPGSSSQGFGNKSNFKRSLGESEFKTIDGKGGPMGKVVNNDTSTNSQNTSNLNRSTKFNKNQLMITENKK